MYMTQNIYRTQCLTLKCLDTCVHLFYLFLPSTLHTKSFFLQLAIILLKQFNLDESFYLMQDLSKINGISFCKLLFCTMVFIHHFLAFSYLFLICCRISHQQFTYCGFKFYIVLILDIQQSCMNYPRTTSGNL